MIEYKLFEQLCERFPNNSIALQKSYNNFRDNEITKKYQTYINDASFWTYSLSPEFETIERLVKHLNEIFEKHDIKKLDGHPFILKEEQTEKESFVNLEKVKKEIEGKLEKKYEKDLQQLSILTLRDRVLEDNISNCRSKVDIYEKQITEAEEELFDCYNNLDGLNAECDELNIKCHELHAELNELRSHHNKLKNHWLVKLLKL